MLFPIVTITRHIHHRQCITIKLQLSQIAYYYKITTITDSVLLEENKNYCVLLEGKKNLSYPDCITDNTPPPKKKTDSTQEFQESAIPNLFMDQICTQVKQSSRFVFNVSYIVKSMLFFS